MSIDRLLQSCWLQNSFHEAILFISTRPDYYNFGGTQFFILPIEDTDNPKITAYQKSELQHILDDSNVIETLYVCCDAGISRSPAVALFIAYKLNLTEQIKKIEATYMHFNERLFKKLKGLQWK